jgi:predicted nucleic acid-binding Zn ribbon protein
VKMEKEGWEGPETIGPVVREIISRLGLKELTASSRVFEIWDTVVGSAIALHARPYSFREGILTVNVDSSVWLAQLERYRKRQIRDKLNNHLPNPLVKRVIFRFGELTFPVEK